MGNYLHLFNSEASFQAEYNGESYHEPWVSYTSVESASHVDYNKKPGIDLGLPSGNRWAEYNLGASSVSGAGDTYAWAEVSTKESYTQANYTYYNSSTNSYTKYNDENHEYLEMSDDAANVELGKSWQIPTPEDFDELCNYCTSAVVADNGVYYLEFTSIVNENKLRFVADNGDNIALWTSKVEKDTTTPHYKLACTAVGAAGSSSEACYFDIQFTDNRYTGHKIRPVFKS